MEQANISMVEFHLRRFVESIRPKDEKTRKLLDIGYSWDGKTAFLFEIRPQWDDPTKIMNLPFAKLRFVKSSAIWKIYWLLGSGEWRAYEPQSDGTSLPPLLIEIQHDPQRCFFG